MPTGSDTPRYNEWIVARRVVVAGFVSDVDWQGTQDAGLANGAGEPTSAFQVPNLPGRPASGMALQLVAVDGDGAPVAPAGISAAVELVELVRYSGNFDDRAPHVSDVEDPAAPLTPLAFTLPANLVANVRNVGGAQNQFAIRMTSLTAPGAAEVRLLIKPLGGG